MDRLTFLDNGKPAFRFKGCVYKIDVADRLYAYEDTGLTPDEVERLAERAGPISPGGDDRIDELEEAIDNLRFRLDAYENTGLSPKEIAAIVADNKRLHKLLGSIEEVLKWE